MKKILLFLVAFLFFSSPVLALDEIATGKIITATSEAGPSWSASKANDNDNNTYWESQQHAFPQELIVDLSARHFINEITLKVKSSWSVRTENIEVLMSNDNITYTSKVSPIGYSLGSQTITFPSPFPTGRYIKLKVNSNSVSPSAQVADFQIYGSVVPTQKWEIQSVDAMKATKDRVCTSAQLNDSDIDTWVTKAEELGVTHIAISQPYDNPSCGNAVSYTERWITKIRAHNLKVWHRHMPLAFEGIYSTTKKNDDDYLEMIATYIKSNSNQFEEGDIFTPIPEPQNGGITNVSYCAQNVCQFSNSTQFNRWLKTAMYVTEEAFKDIGLADQVKVGYFGFDGFITWGDNNPDWQGVGFLTQSAVDRMGVLAIDHYPHSSATMVGDLQELRLKWPNTPVVIGEWGTITATSSAEQVLQIQSTFSTFSATSYILGTNYWHMGNGSSNEALVNADFTVRPAYDVLKNYYHNLLP